MGVWGINEAKTSMGALPRSLVLGPEFVGLKWLGHATVGRFFSPWTGGGFRLGGFLHPKGREFSP